MIFHQMWDTNKNSSLGPSHLQYEGGSIKFSMHTTSVYIETTTSTPPNSHAKAWPLQPMHNENHDLNSHQLSLYVFPCFYAKLKEIISSQFLFRTQKYDPLQYVTFSHMYLDFQ